MKDCHDRSTKESWLSKREKKKKREQDHDNLRDRSDGQENYKKSKSVKSKNNWMSLDGEELSGSKNSEEE